MLFLRAEHRGDTEFAKDILFVRVLSLGGISGCLKGSVGRNVMQNDKVTATGPQKTNALITAHISLLLGLKNPSLFLSLHLQAVLQFVGLSVFCRDHQSKMETNLFNTFYRRFSDEPT